MTDRDSGITFITSCPLYFLISQTNARDPWIFPRHSNARTVLPFELSKYIILEVELDVWLLHWSETRFDPTRSVDTRPHFSVLHRAL